MRKLISHFLFAALCAGSPFAYSMPCNMTEAWSEDGNKTDKNTPDQLNPDKDTSVCEPPRNDIEVMDGLFKPRNIGMLQDTDTDPLTISVGEDDPYGEVIDSLNSEESVREGIQDGFGQLTEVVDKIAGFDDSALFDATKISMKENRFPTMTNGAVSEGEGRSLVKRSNFSTGELLEGIGIDGVALFALQTIYNIANPEMLQMPDPSKMSPLDKSKFVLGQVPVLGTVYTAIVDMVEAGKQHLPAENVILIGIIDAIQGIIGFVGTESVGTEYFFSEVIKKLSEKEDHVARDYMNDILNNLRSGDYKNSATSAIKWLIGFGYDDIYTCPHGTFLDPFVGCRVKSILGLKDYKPAPYVKNDILYVSEYQHTCPPGFKQDNDGCASFPPIKMIGRTVDTYNGSVRIQPWQHACPRGTSYDEDQDACRVEGLPEGVMKDYLVHQQSGWLELRKKKGPCPGDFQAVGTIGNTEARESDGGIVKTCRSPMNIFLLDRRAFSDSKNNLYVSKANEPDDKLVLKYFADKKIYDSASPDALFTSFINDEKSKGSFEATVDYLKSTYPLLMMSIQQKLMELQAANSFHYLVPFQANTAAQLGLLRGYVQSLDALHQMQLGKLMNIAYSGIANCDRDLLTEVAYRTSADSLSWVKYCTEANQRKGVLTFDGNSVAYSNRNKILHSEEELRNKTMELTASTLDTINKNKNLALKGLADSIETANDDKTLYNKMLETAKTLIMKTGQTMADKSMNRNLICVFDHPAFSDQKKNCTLQVYVAARGVRSHNDQKDIHIQCWGGEGKDVGNLLSHIQANVMHWGTKWDNGFYSRANFVGDCGKSTSVKFHYDYSKGTMLNPDQLTHPIVKNLRETKDYYESHDYSDSPYRYNKASYSRSLSGSPVSDRELFPKIDKRYASYKPLSDLFHLQKEAKDALTLKEDTYFKENIIPTFTTVINPFLKNKLDPDQYSKFHHFTDDTWGHCVLKHSSCYFDIAVGRGAFTLLEYVYLRTAATLCEQKKQENRDAGKEEGDCYNLVLPYARIILDTVMNLDELQLVSGEDGKTMFSQYQKRPKRKFDNRDPRNKHYSLTTDNYDKTVVAITVRTPLLKSPAVINLSENQYEKLGAHPGHIYSARMMEKAYFDYGGWIKNLDDMQQRITTAQSTPPGPIDRDIEQFLHEMSLVTDSDDLYQRSQGIKTAVGKIFANRDKDNVTNKYARIPGVVGAVWQAAINNIVNVDAANELFKDHNDGSSGNDKRDDYDLLKSGWTVTANNSPVTVDHSPETNILSIPVHALDGTGPVVFRKTTSPVYEYTDADKKEQTITFNGAVKVGFTVDCIDKAKEYTLEDGNPSLLTVTIGSPSTGKVFSIEVDDNDSLYIHGLDTNNSKAIQLDSKNLFCKKQKPGNQDSQNSKQVNSVELFFGKKANVKKDSDNNDNDTGSPYIYQLLLNGRLMSGEVPEDIFHDIDITQVEITSNYQTTQGLSLYHPFTFYYLDQSTTTNQE